MKVEAEAEAAAHEVTGNKQSQRMARFGGHIESETEDGDGEEEEEDWDRGLTTPVRNSDLCQCVSFTPHLKPVWPILAN